nr:unnamed protein product [Callosobruchus analis]
MIYASKSFLTQNVKINLCDSLVLSIINYDAVKQALADEKIPAGMIETFKKPTPRARSDSQSTTISITSDQRKRTRTQSDTTSADEEKERLVKGTT